MRNNILRVGKERLAAALFIISIAGLMYIFYGIYSLGKKERTYQSKIALLDKRLTLISTARTTLQQALKKSIQKKMRHESSLLDERKRREVLEEEVERLFSETAGLKASLRGYEDENARLRNKIGELEEEKALLNKKFISFKEIEQNLQYKIKRLLVSPEVELGQVVVMPPLLNGKILKANRTYNFVIMDLGENDGVKQGMVLMAYRQDAPIGEIGVEKAYDEFSIGRAEFQWVGDELGVGDIVKGKE